ncbi:helicase [Paenibacillus sp. CAA11]|uniref:HRDC domain-containing protein n=1 Tax=Paenibacillus sp. CAA11 TaxID=1532905 RepID=UPI000D346BEC|nr:HRDC domain-containing protein [Paenibacillus sp. CAA11]AWB43963.1 helicase [Paenibacillus sp. CAA11]
MRIVFLNSLEKRVEGELTSSSQVWIGEEQGLWRIGWDEMGDQESPLWYEGDSWSEMLHIYRHRLAAKLAEGFRPVIEGIFHEGEAQGSGRTLAAQKLICYSELHANEELYNELCAWRRRRAAQERKAPYLIASNRLLRMISAFVPKTSAELLQLPGVGEGKSAEYGADLLNITEGASRTHDFPLTWVFSVIDQEVFLSWQYKQKEAKYRQEIEKFNLRRSLMEGVQEGLSLEQLSLRTELDRREVLEMLEVLGKEGHSLEPLVALELADTSEAEQNRVWEAYQKLGDEYLKPVLQHVYGPERIAAEGEKLERLYELLRLIRLRYRSQPDSRAVRSAG